MGIVKKLSECLTKTRNSILQKLSFIFKKFKKIDEEFLKELRNVLISADIGFKTSSNIIEQLRETAKRENIKDSEQLKITLKDILTNIFRKPSHNISDNSKDEKFPKIITVIGVNGAGKTTSIGKIANLYKNQGKRVMIAAGDTFRAAAIDQLEIWAQRVECEFVCKKEGSDPASVIYEAIEKFKKDNFDCLICDTAGRLHNIKNLMEELRKINKIIQKSGINHETLLVLDATTGQNAPVQIKSFKEVADINGIIMTKLDGTSKGGVVFSIKNEFDVDIKFIGTGELIDDIEYFNEIKFCEEILN